MKKALLFLLAFAFLFPDAAFAKIKRDRQMAYIVAPFVSVLKERRPESAILVMASKGDQFVVKRVGEYWVQVYVPPNNDTGWIELGMEKPKVEIVTESGITPFTRSILIGVPSLLLITLLSVLLVRFFSRLKHQKALAAIGHIEKTTDKT